MVNLQDTPTAGPLTAADLDRKTNTGRIYHLHRVAVLPDACAEEGGTFAESVPSGLVSMRRHRDIRDTVALVIALAVTGYAFHIVWPLVG